MFKKNPHFYKKDKCFQTKGQSNTSGTYAFPWNTGIETNLHHTISNRSNQLPFFPLFIKNISRSVILQSEAERRLLNLCQN